MALITSQFTSYFSLLTCIALSTCYAGPSSPFIKQEKASPVRSASRHQLREELINLFDECIHTLLSEMEMLNSLSHQITICHLGSQRLEKISQMIAFFDHGTLPTSTQTEQVSPCTVQVIMQKLIETQRIILITIRKIIEESKECCFSTTRSKEALKNYQTIVQTFIQESRNYTTALDQHHHQSIMKPISSPKE